MIAKDVIVVGAAHLPGGAPKSKMHEKGFIRGFDVRTGKRLWIFHTIPDAGEFGNDTWEKDSWAYTGNTGVWAQMSVGRGARPRLPAGRVADRRLLRRPSPGQRPVRREPGGARPQDRASASGTSSSCTTASGTSTFPCAPILADITVNGRPIKAIAQPTKQAGSTCFDRETGEPVWPIEERRVPKGDVPGEWYSPTQPFVTKPPAYDRQGVAVDDLIDFTPELRAEAVKVVSRYKMGPLFTPPSSASGEGPLGTLMRAVGDRRRELAGRRVRSRDEHRSTSSRSESRSVDRAGAARDRENAPAIHATAAATGQRRAARAIPVQPRRAAGMRAAARRCSGAARRGGSGGLTVQGLPLLKPPYGTITAIDLNKGDDRRGRSRTARRRTTSRTIPALERPEHSAHRPRDGRIGMLVTKTLVIAGEARVRHDAGRTRGAMLRAYDKATGNEVGAVYMPAPQTGSPMTYMLNGRQYMIVPISGRVTARNWWRSLCRQRTDASRDLSSPQAD